MRHSLVGQVPGSAAGLSPMKRCMTLFASAAADPESVFYRALDRWGGGALDPQTLKLLETGGRF